MVEVLPVRPASTPSRTPSATGTPALVLWTALVVAAIAAGTWWIDGDAVQLRAAPLYGRWDWHPGLGLLPATAVGGAAVWWGPALVARCRWRTVPLLAGAWASLWALALAASDGWSAVTAPLVSRHEYEPFAAGIGDLGPFLGSYVERLAERPIHVQGHPPGPVVAAWLFDRVGLGGAGWLAVLVLAGWGVAVAAALVAARAVAGEEAARRAAPALALLPAAVWAGTSFDAVFAALVGGSVALLVVAATRRSVPWGAAAGVVAGIALLFSYGAAAPLLVGVFVAGVLRCPGRVWAAAAAGGAVALLAAAAAGFWWPAGLAATGDRYWDGIAADRPAAYLTLLGNPAALALATGPAVAVGLWKLRGRAALLPWAALVAVAAADLSQMSRGEVERIWLPFVPFLALAAPGRRRGWLAAQAGVALAVQSTLISAW